MSVLRVAKVGPLPPRDGDSLRVDGRSAVTPCCGIIRQVHNGGRDQEVRRTCVASLLAPMGE
jgi:hypothetical protein